MNKGKSNLSFSSSCGKKEYASLKINYMNCNSTLHSDEGEYTQDGKRHVSGGHGQTSIDYLDKMKIDYNINIEYNNGVRVGNIPGSKQKNMRIGNNHTWFPKTWSIADIRQAGEAISSKYSNQRINDGGKRTIVYNGVKVTAIYNNGEISSLFPSKNQPGGKKYDK